MDLSQCTLPDPFALQMERRDFTVKIGEEWTVVTAHAQVLIPRVLYVPVADSSGLREGGLLSRNLRLTEKLDGFTGDPARDRMQTYEDGIYSMIRTLMRLPHQYLRGEVPRLDRWRATLRFVTQFLRQLSRATPEQRTLFAHETLSRAAAHDRDTDPGKVFARERTREIGQTVLKKARVDPASLDQLVWSSDMALQRRISGSRIIAERADYRFVVCAHVLDSVFVRLRWLRENVHVLHDNQEVFGITRTSNRILAAAEHLRLFSRKRLTQVHLRPMQRTVSYILAEMETCARALENGQFGKAQELLRRISRSIFLLDVRRRLEEVLLGVSQVVYCSTPLTRVQIWDLLGELQTIENMLKAPDPRFGEPIELGFHRKVIPEVLPMLADARGATLTYGTRGGNAREVYALLKAACGPI